MLRRVLKYALPISAALGVTLSASAAFASGFAAARFGGEHGNPTESNPASIYYNPGGIGLSTGTNVMLDLTLAWRTASYDRPASAISAEDPSDAEIEANSGEATLDNILLSPMAGVTSDFGIDDSPFVMGLAFFAPFGGQAVWDQTEASEQFPGAEDGSQRWYSIDGTIRTLSVSLAAAYRVEPLRLSFGLAGNLYLSTINTLRARNSDGSDDLTAGGRLKEGRSLIDTSSTDFGLGVGSLWEAIEDELWIGASWQSAPNLDGDMRTEGTLVNLLGVSQRTESDVLLTTSLPDIYRFGARYRPAPKLELRLFGDFTRWSNLDQQCLVQAGVDNVQEVCATDETGAQSNAGADNAGQVIQILRRDWKDTFGVRAGASYWVIPQLEILLGAGYDGNAIPDAHIDAALMDMPKATVSLGFDYALWDWASLMITATNVFYVERDTTGEPGNQNLALPSTQPGNQGVYNQNIFLVGTNLQLTF